MRDGGKRVDRRAASRYDRGPGVGGARNRGRRSITEASTGDSAAPTPPKIASAWREHGRSILVGECDGDPPAIRLNGAAPLHVIVFEMNDGATERGRRRSRRTPFGFAAAFAGEAPTPVRVTLDEASGVALEIEIAEAGEPLSIVSPNIDRAVRDSAGRTVVVGWCANAEDFHFSFAGEKSAAFARPRLDVSEHLGVRGRHGFVLCGTTAAEAPLLDIRDAANRLCGRVRVPTDPASTPVVYRTATAALGAPRPDALHEFRAAFSALAPPAVSARRIKETIRLRAPEKPKLAIVVPFYADVFYLHDHLQCQHLDRSYEFEWVFVCDDPRIEREFRLFFETHQKRLAAPTTAIVLDANAGYAAANNAGAETASAPLLLLLNSDAIFRTTEPIETAIDLIDRGEADACGFTLLYEDGTLQHGGSELAPSPHLGGALVSRHRGAGLPPHPRLLSGAPLDVDFATGASLLIRKPKDGVVFDSGYVIGDYEDADYCLRIRRGGGRVKLVPTGDILHLERQSLKSVGEAAARDAVHFANALRFNARLGPDAP